MLLPRVNDSPPSTSPRADACAVLLALVFPSLVTWIYFIVLPDNNYSEGVQQTAYGIGKGLQFVFPVVWVLAVQRQRLRFRAPGTKGLAESITFGIFIMVAMLVLYHAWLASADLMKEPREEVRQKVLGFGADTLPKYIALGVFYSLCHSFLEEYYWRWFVFGQLRRLIPLWPAVVVSSLGFMAHHVLVLAKFFGWDSPATYIFSLAVAVGGAVWAWLYHRGQSLYGPWLSHLFVDAGIFTIGYYMVRDLLGS